MIIYDSHEFLGNKKQMEKDVASLAKLFNQRKKFSRAEGKKIFE